MASEVDMVIVDGIQYRPEDVPGSQSATDTEGREVKTGPVTSDDMVIVDGVLYRPEDDPRKGKRDDSDDVSTVTSKVAEPRNKARTPRAKG